MKRQNGFALIGAMMVLILLAIVTIAILSMSGADRKRAIRLTKSETREGCAYAGMNYARTYFGNKFGQWNTYMATPNKYNPMNLPSGQPGTKADLSTTAALNTIKTSNPELFLDLDSDGKSDVYIFIRDNYDEFAPAAPNFTRDNDQNAIVGAVCISSTMQPKREDGTGNLVAETDRLVVESLLAVNQQSSGYAQVKTDGNLNND